MGITGILEQVENGIGGIIGEANKLTGSTTNTLIGAAVGTAAVGGAVALGVAASKASSSNAKRKTGKRIKHTKRGWKQDRARRSKQKWEVAYQRRKRKNKRHTRRSGRIRHTKNGQPYIILKSGKAKFIKRR